MVGWPSAGPVSTLPSSEPVIRRATLDDIDALAELRYSMLAAFTEPDNFEPGWREAFAEWQCVRLVGPGFAWFIAELADGRVVAGTQGELIIGQPGPTISRTRVYVTNVSTLPEHRGQGLATKCMDAVLAWAKDQGATAAMLNAAPMGANIYTRAGFEVNDHPDMRRPL